MITLAEDMTIRERCLELGILPDQSIMSLAALGYSGGHALMMAIRYSPKNRIVRWRAEAAYQLWMDQELREIYVMCRDEALQTWRDYCGSRKPRIWPPNW